MVVERVVGNRDMAVGGKKVGEKRVASMPLRPGCGLAIEPPAFLSAWLAWPMTW